MDAGMQKFDLTLIGHFAIDTIILGTEFRIAIARRRGIGARAAEAFETKGHCDRIESWQTSAKFMRYSTTTT